MDNQMRLEARMVHLEKVIEQQQMTIHSLKERLGAIRQVEVEAIREKECRRCEKMLEDRRSE